MTMEADRHHNDFTMSDVIWLRLDDAELRHLRFDASIARASGLTLDALEEFLDATNDV